MKSLSHASCSHFVVFYSLPTHDDDDDDDAETEKDDQEHTSLLMVSKVQDEVEMK